MTVPPTDKECGIILRAGESASFVMFDPRPQLGSAGEWWHLAILYCPVTGALDPTDIIDGHRLRRPSVAQLQLIQAFFTDQQSERLMTPFDPVLRAKLWGEAESVKAGIVGDDPLWAIVEVSPNPGVALNAGLHLLETAVALLPDLQSARFPVTLHGNLGYTYFSPKLETCFPGTVIHLSPALLSTWSELTRRLQSCESGYPWAFSAARRLERVCATTKDAHLRVVGMLGVLESILVPSGTPSRDRSGLLIGNIQSAWAMGAQRPDWPFGRASESEIWSALYHYRSVCAHGGMPVFASGKLQKIESAAQGGSFLLAACQGLLRFAVEDPLGVRSIRDS